MARNSSIHLINHIKQHRLLLQALLCFVAVAMMLFVAAPAMAAASGDDACMDQASGDEGANCDNCIDSVIYQNYDSGANIINAMFTAINNVLANVEQSFFNGFVNSSTFQGAISTAILLYVSMYGIMIAFNMTSYKMHEVVNRLIKIAIVYMLTSPSAWASFTTWIENPIMGGMNQIINEFTNVAEGGSGALTVVVVPNGSGTDTFDANASGSVSGQGMDPVLFSNMFGSSLTTVFSLKMCVAIIASMKTGFFGWLIAIFLFWALVEFSFMMLGALITYAKSIIGLAFLFGIAPMFIAFLLFEKTRQIFFAWLSMVLAFALQPVLLFAFLSFYVALVNDAVPNLLKDTDGNLVNYCWMRWFSMPGTLWDAYMQNPTSSGALVTHWYDASGGTLKEHIGVANLLYFLMICHLGRTFTGYIAGLANELSGGMGAGVTSGEELQGIFEKGFGQMTRLLKGK